MHLRTPSRYWAVAILAAIALGMCVAVPLRACAIVCRPRLVCHGDVCARSIGCPKAKSPPTLSGATLVKIINRYLVEHPPVVRIKLRRSLGSYPPVAYEDLKRAGLLRIVAGKPGQEPGPKYDLTEKGRALFSRSNHAQRGPYVIAVPVGQFQYMHGSAIVSRDELNEPATTFKYYFGGNANAATLLRLGPAMDWIVDDYWHPHVSLDLVGHVGDQTLPLRFCYGRWVVRPPHPCGIP